MQIYIETKKGDIPLIQYMESSLEKYLQKKEQILSRKVSEIDSDFSEKSFVYRFFAHFLLPLSLVLLILSFIS